MKVKLFIFSFAEKKSYLKTSSQSPNKKKKIFRRICEFKINKALKIYYMQKPELPRGVLRTQSSIYDDVFRENS